MVRNGWVIKCTLLPWLLVLPPLNCIFENGSWLFAKSPKYQGCAPLTSIQYLAYSFPFFWITGTLTAKQSATLKKNEHINHSIFVKHSQRGPICVGIRWNDLTSTCVFFPELFGDSVFDLVTWKPPWGWMDQRGNKDRCNKKSAERVAGVFVYFCWTVNGAKLEISKPHWFWLVSWYWSICYDTYIYII